MQRYLGAASVLALMLASSPAGADDSSAALGMGGLAFTQSQSIRMADEDLRISPKEVRIRFAFTNDSAKDIDTIVGFPLPDIDTMEFSNSPIGTITNDPVNFVGFAVKADGHPVQVSVDQRAFLNGRDVTQTVKSVGLPINVIEEGSYKQLEALSKAKRQVLKAAGLAEFDDNDNAFPHWIVRTRFYWRQHFPAGNTVVLEQNYQPVTGQSMFGPMELNNKSDDSDYYAKNFCLDQAARATCSCTSPSVSSDVARSCVR